MPNNERRLFKVDDARIMYRNFRGEARQYNNAGDRNFNLVLTEEQAEEFINAGFRVRVKPPRDGFEEPLRTMTVKVGYKYRPPRVVIIDGHKKRELDEDTIDELDYMDIDRIDMTIRPYYWSRPNGDSGVTAYLNSMFVTLVEDPYAEKYDKIGEPETADDIPF